MTTTSKIGDFREKETISKMDCTEEQTTKMLERSVRNVMKKYLVEVSQKHHIDRERGIKLKRKVNVTMGYVT